MKKYTMKEIINEKKVVICRTQGDCAKIVKHYVDNFNMEDVYYNIDEHENPEDYNKDNPMCIRFSNSEWGYASFNFYRGNKCIIDLSQVDFEEEPKRMRGFEVCSKRKTNIEEITLPRRGTSKAMAYDFFSPITASVQPGDVVKIWTDVKAYMQDTECLVLNVRSSMGGKFMLANTQGWIDADYYNNENNEGNIGFFLKNISDEPQLINKGDRIGQGAFFNFLVSDNGNPEEEIVRKGGFGSSGR